MTKATAIAGAAAVLVAILFGVADALLYQDGSGNYAYWVANMSSFYLALAFAAGWAVAARKAPTWIAAGVGLVAIITALAAFYGWQVEHFHLYGATARFLARRYVAGGLVTGPLFGALGALWSRQRSWYAAAILAASFILEPSAWRAHLRYQPFPLQDRQAEIAVGVFVLIIAIAGSMRRWLSTRAA